MFKMIDFYGSLLGELLGSLLASLFTHFLQIHIQ